MYEHYIENEVDKLVKVKADIGKNDIKTFFWFGYNKMNLKKENLAVIVIPLYKSDISQIERASLGQCLKILSRWPFCFVIPRNLDISQYSRILNSTHCSYKFETFDEENFISLKSYSKLLLKADFYERFSEFDYMLIYQLDCWVFKDELKYWCEQGFDFIGAPWFEKDNKMHFAGNGGFSLRKIKAFLNILNSKAFFPLKVIFAENRKSKMILNILNFPCNIYRFLYQYIKLNGIDIIQQYEDIAFVRYGHYLYKEFKIAPPDIALKFSFETQPERLYKENDFNLPFGCHAFKKYNPDFWKQFIDLNIMNMDEDGNIT